MKRSEKTRLMNVALDLKYPIETRKQAMRLLSADFRVNKTVQEFLAGLEEK